MARPLTARQEQVYAFIHDKITVLGYCPTVREIGDFLGIKSPNGVMCHLRALERKGLICRTANKSRAIELRDQSTPPAEPAAKHEASLTVRGCVAQGTCKLFEAPQPFDFVEVLRPSQRYLLQFNGHDLVDYSIADGDMLVVEPGNHVSGDALRLVQCPDGTIELKPPVAEEQADLPAQVIGSIVGVLRIHRPRLGVKPPHLQLRTAQPA